MTDDALDTIDLVLLLRLALSGKKPLGTAKVRDALFPFVERRMTASAWNALIVERVAALRDRSALTEDNVVTPTGQRMLLRTLGVAALPRNWAEACSRLLPALALGLPAKQAKALDAQRLRGRLIRERLGADGKPTPSPKEALDALCWQALGSTESGGLGVDRVKLLLLQRELGMPIRSLAQAVNALCWRALGEEPRTDFAIGPLRQILVERSIGRPLRLRNPTTDKLAEVIAAQVAGTTQTDPRSLQRALVERWLLGTDAHPPTAAANERPPSLESSDAHETRPAPDAQDARSASGALEHDSLATFAKRVQDTADALVDGRYDEQRVFISAVWDRLRDDPIVADMTLATFKTYLTVANREGLLNLNRADLVGAMDPQRVAASETLYLNATFHFVVTKAQR